MIPADATCARCGKGAKDGVVLTKSHAPPKAILKRCVPGDCRPSFVRHYLCVLCHQRYTLIEQVEIVKVFLECGQRLLTLHDRFIKGELDV
jgi:hypothetical protein